MNVDCSIYDQNTEEFLSIFEADNRKYVIEYSKYLSSLDVDVIILMARKAACVFRCFESLGMTKRTTLVTTERILAFNVEWLSGKKIALVDDALISGTSLFRTRGQLISAGADVTVHTLFINKKWHASKLIVPDHNFISLNDNSASQLSSSLVDAMSIVPRPYSIDYPLFEPITIKSCDINVLCSVPGWNCFDVATSLQKNHSVFSYTVQPNVVRLRELDSSFGWNISNRAMCKIRIYGKIIGAEARFSILPIVALGPIKRKELIELFESAVNENSGSKKILIDGCVSGSAKFQFIQFLMAYRLAEIWSKKIKNILPYSFSTPSLDVDEVGLLFPPHITSSVISCCSCNKILFQNADSNTIHFEEPHCETFDIKSVFEVQEILAEKFKELYFNKELPARVIVKKLGAKAFENNDWKDLVNRLRNGFTVPDLISCIPNDSESDRMLLVSNFLDLSIDRGALVPISSKLKSIENRNSDIYYRAYRHGEEIIVTLREEKLLLAMLGEFLSTSRRDIIPLTWMEKLLVLFIRCGVTAGFLNPYYGELRDPREKWELGPVIGVTNYLHGAITQKNINRLYEFDPSLSFCNMLCRKKRLKKDVVKVMSAAGNPRFLAGYTILDNPEVPIKAKEESMAKRIGRRLGEISYKGKQNGTYAPLNINKLTLIATCLTTEDSLLALAAEINIFAKFWRAHVDEFNSVEQRKAALELGKELRNKNTPPGKAWVAINNGRWKFKSSLKHLGEKFVKEIGEYFKSIDVDKCENWYDFWPDLDKNDESDDSRIVSRYLRRAGDLLLVLNILIRLWELQVISKFDSNINSENRLSDIEIIVKEITDDGVKRKIRKIYQSGISDSTSTNEALINTVNHITQYVKHGYSILSFVKKVVEPKGKLKRVHYFPYTVGIYIQDTVSRASMVKILYKVYSVIDNVNIRLRSKPMPQMYSQKQRSISVPGIQDRLFVVNESRMDAGLILVSAKGTEIVRWALYLIFKFMKELSDHLSLKYVVFSGLPKHYQPFLVDGDNRLENPDFEDICLWCIKPVNQIKGNIFHFYSSSEEQDIITQEIKSGIGNDVIEEKKSEIEIDGFDDKFSFISFIAAKEVVMNKSQKLTDVGVVLITARELRGVQGFFDTKGGYKRGTGKQSGRTYLKARLPLTINNQNISITVTKSIQQGQQAIMAAVSALIEESNPRIVVLLGIAGSIDSSLDLGDVVIADKVIFYEDRVETDKGTIHRLNSKLIPAWSLDKSSLFFADHGDPAVLAGINGDNFKVIPAPVGSGEAILKAELHEIRDYLKSMDDRTAVLEKESAGFLQYFFEESLIYEVATEGVFIIRGVSDSADRNKDDSYQEKAAFNCMVVLHELLKSIHL